MQISLQVKAVWNRECFEGFLVDLRYHDFTSPCHWWRSCTGTRACKFLSHISCKTITSTGKKRYCYKFTDIMLSQLGDSLSRLLHDYACSGIRSGKKAYLGAGIVILNLTRAKPFWDYVYKLQFTECVETVDEN